MEDEDEWEYEYSETETEVSRPSEQGVRHAD